MGNNVIVAEAAGGPGGSGSVALGGGLYFNNSSDQTTLFNFTNSTANNNQLTAGDGGVGGNAGFAGLNHITGGIGGAAGASQGGGVFIFSDPSSIDSVTISNAVFDNDTITSGFGGPGGQGENAIGGNGGPAQGGGLYVTNTNTNVMATLNLMSGTLAGNLVTANGGGIAGTGTTTNGGFGGQGGNGGTAQGGGLFVGGNTAITAINSTFGALSNNPQVTNANVLVAGTGGRGGNGGTAGNTLLSQHRRQRRGQRCRSGLRASTSTAARPLSLTIRSSTIRPVCRSCWAPAALPATRAAAARAHPGRSRSQRHGRRRRLFQQQRLEQFRQHDS